MATEYKRDPLKTIQQLREFAKKKYPRIAHRLVPTASESRKNSTTVFAFTRLVQFQILSIKN